MRVMKSDPVKFCSNCGAQLQRKRFNGNLEDYTKFLRRQNCDQICRDQAMLKLKKKLLKPAIQEIPHRSPNGCRGYWDIETPHGVPMLKGRCRLCGEIRFFPASSHNTGWNNDTRTVGKGRLSSGSSLERFLDHVVMDYALRNMRE